MPPTIQASVKFLHFEKLYLRYFSTISNWAILLTLRRSFQGCRRIFPNLSMSKVEKNREKLYTNGISLFSVVALFITVPTHPAKKDCNPLIIIMCYLFSWNSPWPGHFGDHCWLSRWCPWIGCVDGKDPPSDTARSQIMPCKPFDNLDWIWYK